MTRIDARSGVLPPGAVEEVATRLASGDPVGLPTDTVYGLACDPAIPGAVDRIFALKGRPAAMALPVLVANTDQAEALVAEIPPIAAALMAEFWPGALTVVLLRRPNLRLWLGEDEVTVAVRNPAHPVALAVCRRVGPVTATSANLHGRPPLTSADAVEDTFPDLLVVDAGACESVPSTVVDCSDGGLHLLREGGIPWDAVRAVRHGLGR